MFYTYQILFLVKYLTQITQYKRIINKSNFVMINQEIDLLCIDRILRINKL